MNTCTDGAFIIMTQLEFDFDVEEWFDIPTWAPRYKASNKGRVKSIQGKKEIILKPHDIGLGYLSVALTHGKRRKHELVHRIIASIFHDNPLNLPYVNHKDLNPSNNHPDNLEWCTQRENVTHYQENGNDNGLPTGVSVCNSNKKLYASHIRLNKKSYYLGAYDTPQEARVKYLEALNNWNDSYILPSSLKPNRGLPNGVYRVRRSTTFFAQIVIKRKHIRLGTYKTAEEAELVFKKTLYDWKTHGIMPQPIYSTYRTGKWAQKPSETFVETELSKLKTEY